LIESYHLSSKLHIENRLTDLCTDVEFKAFVNEVFEHQLEYNATYRAFLEHTKRKNRDLTTFLPIELFKNHRVSCQETEEAVFKSSGTTSTGRSTHFVFDRALYEHLSKTHFESIYGPLGDYTILALLPSYLENGESSLVHMVQYFMKFSHSDSDFVLHKPAALKNKLEQLAEQKRPTLLFGVSYALLDFAEINQIDFPELTIMETGGMKGRRKELTRPELHEAISKGFISSAIHSEYGMTELLSQGYSKDGEWFKPPFWMRATTTEISDPFEILPAGKRGLLAFTDLANYHSCAFIQTRDIGIVKPDGTFKVEGRLDHSDLRGCNLLFT
jgi:hypothetical protein